MRSLFYKDAGTLWGLSKTIKRASYKNRRAQNRWKKIINKEILAFKRGFSYALAFLYYPITPKTMSKRSAPYLTLHPIHNYENPNIKWSDSASFSS